MKEQILIVLSILLSVIWIFPAGAKIEIKRCADESIMAGNDTCFSLQHPGYKVGEEHLIYKWNEELLFSYNDNIKSCSLSFSNGVILTNVIIADTQDKRAQGLSNLDDVGVGMLFVFPKLDNLVFWMKDTRVPLSIGFFDENNRLFRIDDMFPYSEQYHFSLKPSKLALELKQGQFAQKKIKVGVKLTQIQCE